MNAQALNTLAVGKPARLATAIAALLLSACGGGGGGGGPPAPEPTVATMNINPRDGNLQTLMVTIEGANLAQGLSVASPQCTSLTLTSTPPNASDAATAYYLCATTAAAASTVTVSATRSSDGAALKTASFTIGAPTTIAESIAGEGAVAANGTNPAIAGTAKFSQKVTVTITGANVNQGLDVSSGSCSAMALSTSPPFVSSASTAYYRCLADQSTGSAQVIVAPVGDPLTVLANPLFTVNDPEVTLVVKRGVDDTAVTLGTVVISLSATEAPITVMNYLNYVNAGFYNGTIFDLVAKNPLPTLIVGGRYGPTSGSPPPTPKATKPAIPLEVATGLLNVQWSVGMDRLPSGPNTATSGFYINLVDNPSLNAVPGTTGFAVFGNVSAGADVVTQMANSGCAAVTGFSPCLPGPNIVIESAVQTR